MEKTKIEQRVENAFYAFFDDERFNENSSLTFANNTSLFQEESSKGFTEKADVLVKVIKQVFLFFPGTFFLFNLSLLLTIFTLNPPVETTNLLYPERLALFLLVSALMTILGLGNIKDIKHLIIPASIMLFAAVSGALVAAFGGSLKFVDDYAIYLLPAALIIPFLAKGWVDSWEAGKIDS